MAVVLPVDWSAEHSVEDLVQINMDGFGKTSAVSFPEILLQLCHQLKKYKGGGVGKLAGLDSSPWQYAIFCLYMCSCENLYLNSLLRLFFRI